MYRSRPAAMGMATAVELLLGCAALGAAVWSAAPAAGLFTMLSLLFGLSCLRAAWRNARELAIAAPRLRLDDRGMELRELGEWQAERIPWRDVEALRADGGRLWVIRLGGHPHPVKLPWWRRLGSWLRSGRRWEALVAVHGLDGEPAEHMDAINAWLEDYHRYVAGGEPAPAALPEPEGEIEKKAGKAGGSSDSGGAEAAVGLVDFVEGA